MNRVSFGASIGCEATEPTIWVPRRRKLSKNDMLFSVLLFFVDLLLQGCNPLLEVVPCCLILALEFL